MGTMMTSSEVVFSSGSKEADLRIFFMCFLIVNLATHFYMDDYFGVHASQTLRVFVV